MLIFIPSATTKPSKLKLPSILILLAEAVTNGMVTVPEVGTTAGVQLPALNQFPFTAPVHVCADSCLLESIMLAAKAPRHTRSLK
ncbi:MAG: hypothetical protein EAZ97_00960 [Bacteroidetes bacterium]|nr:MAG: hypothetical protein EAZ97_00960 [Bacteroidota bacterium]